MTTQQIDRDLAEKVMGWEYKGPMLGGHKVMLTREQMAEIRKRVLGVFDEKAEKDLIALISDRTEIAQELERIRDRERYYSPTPGVTELALTALIERIGE